MFYSRMCILTDEFVTALQMEEFKEKLGLLMQEMFNTVVEAEVVLDIFKKKVKAPIGLKEEEMDEILEQCDFAEGQEL